jgi:hypothetical protein
MTTVGKPVRLREVPCPVCSHPLSGATGLDTVGGPSPGDISVCIRCAAVLQFTDALTPMLATDEAIKDLSASQRRLVLKLRALVWKRNHQH